MRIVVYILLLLNIYSCVKPKRKTEQLNIVTTVSRDINLEDSVVKKSFNCNFETYLKYKDSIPLFASPNGKIIRYFRFEDDPDYDFGGTLLFNNSELGWLQIGDDDIYPDLKGFWIQSFFVEIGTINYSNQPISVYDQPNKNSEVIGFIESESYLNVNRCYLDWAYIQNGETKGWLAPEFICTNDVTNCN